ncbi:nuclear transcription factor Y subunit B-3-like [Zingiber officinale]|uniref:Transcription factor CBF/NF-Y/archaeal histone domain-containing protein n=1 Tax=Zingiber officinale TaxID=94328 RepID=A0A8J5FUZ4_ZINOF|nr:nuclear transcription factor Y subunit B-3-like [Zingiber officinale]KAG6491300.1 hypothetical protein ZIOFF_052638 [Zingiber officinale]
MKGKRNAHRGGGGGEALSETESDAVLGGGSSSPKEQDRFLPIANVSRIMKRSLPANAKISKEAKETVQECVSEFISFVTGEASDKCQREKRKTINGDDLLWAMSTLGFDSYVVPLKAYLNRYREAEGDRTLALAAHHRPSADQSMDQEAAYSTDNNNNSNSKYNAAGLGLTGESYPSAGMDGEWARRRN